MMFLPTHLACALSCMLALVACRREPPQTGAPSHEETAPSGQTGVGWRVDLPGEVVRAGVVHTTPGGREEALMPVLPGAVRHAAQACPVDDGTQGGVSRVVFALDATTDGRFVASGPLSTNPFERCLVEHLVHNDRPPTATATHVTVQLQLNR